MKPELEPEHVERLLRQLPVAEAPDALWVDIRSKLDRPVAKSVTPFKRPVRSPVLAAAAVVLAVVGGTYIGVLRAYGAPNEWQVLPLTGVPTVAGATLTQTSDLATGEWLITDSVSSAQLAVGRIGTAEIGPNSRVRLDRGGRTQHRLSLQEGSLDAVIDAPPRLFFVETPTALATDLGCAYTMEVDSTGASRIHVTAGWVELRQGERVSLVAAGLKAEVDTGTGPGTPYPEAFSIEAREALERLDRGGGGMAELETVLAALYPATGFVTARQPSAITMWHLIQRLDGDLRAAVYDRLAALSPPPARVSREGILALERPMLERWRRDLNPMWSEETLPLVVRAARRFWEWAVR